MDAKIQVFGLTFEHHHSGLGVSASRPRLSWRFTCSESSPRNWNQYAYEIQLLRDSTEATHSYHVESSESILVPWPGEPLQSREQVQVRVRSFGMSDNQYDASHGGSATEWSSWATVECAFLSPNCWLARPITTEGDAARDGPLKPTLFRKVHQLRAGGGDIKRSRLYITAFGVYQAYINGHAIGSSLLAPGWTSYHHRLYYEISDVTSLLQQGSRIVIAVEVAEGWYAGRLGWYEGKRFNYGKNLAVMVQLEVDYDQGESDIIVSDETWRSRDSPLVSSEIYDGEIYDARAEPDGWSSSPSFDASLWNGVEILDFPRAQLICPDSPPVRVTQDIRPVSIFKTPSGKTIIDFGQNLVGRLRVESLAGTSGHQVTFAHAEVLENGELGTRPLRSAKSTDKVILSNNMLKDWTPKFTFHGFRYVQVDGWDAEDGVSPGLSPMAIIAQVLHTDMNRIGWFECSHPLVNKLHENALWSMRGNFVSIPTDCPQRDERLGWTGDIQVFAPSANYLFQTTSMLRGWLEDVACEQADEGGIPPLVVPNVVGQHWPPTPQAVWGDVVVLMPWALYLASGDKKILESQYDSMITWVDKAIQRGSDGLWNPYLWQLGDWLDPKAPIGAAGDARTHGALVADAYLVRVTTVLAEISRILGLTDHFQRYTTDVAKLKAAFQFKYVTPSGLLVGDSQTGLSLAILFNIYDDKKQLETAARRLVHLVKKAKFRVATGFVGTPLITHALTATGNHQLAYRMLQEKNRPSWMYPITMGATTIWERWDSMLPDGSINPGAMTSFNHYALGSIVNWLHEVVGGIQARKPGWKEFGVRPLPGGTIRSANVAYESPYGRIECSWSLKDGQGGELFEMELVVPPNTRALVTLPEKGNQETTTVGSGKHVFSCPYVADKWPIDAAPNFIGEVSNGEIV